MTHVVRHPFLQPGDVEGTVIHGAVLRRRNHLVIETNRRAAVTVECRIQIPLDFVFDNCVAAIALSHTSE